MKWIETEDVVRFNEVDEWGMAWHGHYMAWFEVGRMALLRKFDLLPEQIVELGYIAPVIKLNCEFKHPASFGDMIIIRSGVIKPEIAALIFKFEVILKKVKTLLASGETMQVLMTNDRKMIYKVTGKLESRIQEMVDYCNPGGDPS